jgi:ethanolamine utilization protein EutA
LLRTASFVPPADVLVVLSGGPARYLLDDRAPALGDLGPDLATRLGAELRGCAVEIADASIRATVVGAAQFTVQVSGTTIHTSGPPVLPLRNRPVSVVGPGELDALADRAARSLAATEGIRGPAVLAAGWRGSADYATVDAFCRGLLEGLAAAEHDGGGLVLVLDSDVAGLVGAHLVDECGYRDPLVVLDGVQLGRFDFVDIGDYLPHSASVPVTVKSLAFRSP